MSAPDIHDFDKYVNADDGAGRAAREEILRGAISAVSSGASGVHIGPPETVVRVLDGGAGGHGRRVLYLPDPPAPATPGGSPITSVEELNAEGGDDWVALVPADYRLEGGRALWRARLDRWPGWAGSVRVSYRAGYEAANPMPGVVRMGILDVAASQWRNRVTAQPGNLDNFEQQGTGGSRLPKTYWAAVDHLRPPPGGF